MDIETIEVIAVAVLIVLVLVHSYPSLSTEVLPPMCISESSAKKYFQKFGGPRIFKTSLTAVMYKKEYKKRNKKKIE